MKLPDPVRRQFEEFGREGGHRRARSLSPEVRKRIAKKAAMTRWMRVRFGATNFEFLGLPGGLLIDEGLRDYLAGDPSAAACLVALAAPRLRREGVPVPAPDSAWERIVPDPYLCLYRQIEKESGELAHSRYNALLRQAVSFADALAQTR